MSDDGQDQPFDCQDCGACCHLPAKFMDDPARYVDVYPDDEIRRDVKHRTKLRQVAEYRGQGYWGLKMTDGDKPRCQQLDGVLGERVGCTMYELRPTPCRTFTAGTVRCVEARTRMGIPTPEDFVPTDIDAQPKNTVERMLGKPRWLRSEE